MYMYTVMQYYLRGTSICKEAFFKYGEGGMMIWFHDQ